MLGSLQLFIAVISLVRWTYAETDSSVKVRLVGDTHGTGILEVQVYGQWYAHDFRYITRNDAIVICRMLGFNDSGLANIIPNIDGRSATDLVLGYKFLCDGSEHSLSECSSPATWKRKTLPSYWDSEALSALSCEATPIRLVDGDDPYSGRVEVFLKNNWFTVCAYLFSYADASVICRMLGYTDSGVSRVFPASHYGQGYGGVMLSELKCNGYEKDIKQCSAKWGYNSNCDHRQDLGVSCSETQIRLVDGPTNTSGRVEIMHAGKWGTVCAKTGFTHHDIKVICRMVGIQNPNAFGYNFAFYGVGHDKVMLGSLYCDGSEIDIAQCSTSAWSSVSSSSPCLHYDVGVNCEGKTPIRLKDGDSEQSGRVEIYHLGKWGTVSSSYFDGHDLEVICRMLGYTNSSNSFFMSGAYYGQGTGQIVVSNLDCNGAETDIGHCSAKWWPGTGSLSHAQDVGVNCDGHIPIRLVGSDSDPAGRVEIYHDGYYQTVCGRNFDRADLMVVCRMLGIENIPRSAYWRWNPIYSQGLGTIGASHLQCDGSEANIALCSGYMPAVTSGASSCDHTYDISVNCKGGPEKLRLVGGNTNHSGRVEINMAGSWGTICDDDFDRADAAVICRILGYSRPESAIAYSNAHFGQGNVSIVIGNLHCNGMEVNIGQCNPAFDVPSRCDHSEDSGVDCCPNCGIGGQIIG